MATALLDDPVLTTLRRRLEEMYGPRLARVVLFGSRARGDHHADSDYDVAVFLTVLPRCRAGGRNGSGWRIRG